MKKNKTLFIILDGAADRPSAFAAAGMKNLNALAGKSSCGLWSGPYAPGYNPKSMSSVATLELLGYSYKDEPGRGFLEALGIGIKTDKNSVYLRANFSTVDDDLNIIDRRAGRDDHGFDELARFLNNKIKSIEDIRIRLCRSVGHRNVLVLTGKGLSKDIYDSDRGEKPHEIISRNKQAKKTAHILNKYLRLSHHILENHEINKRRKFPANYLLVRSAGSQMRVKPFRKAYGFNACSISGMGIIKGISKYLGVKDAAPGLWENYETNLKKRFMLAEKMLKKHDFVLLHINGADIYGHDRHFRKKIEFLKKVDKEFARLNKFKGANIVVACDHITLSETGEHLFGKTPLLIFTGKKSNNIHKFDEKNCRRGFATKNPMKKLMELG